MPEPPPARPRRRLRIAVTDLPDRDAARTDHELDVLLQRLGNGEGASCERTCDCKIGLVCRDGRCTPKE